MKHRMSTTLQVIVHSLFPGSARIVSPGDVSFAPADLERATGPDGTLTLRMPRCAAPAAPFVLFRLKRSGFSDCRAIATKEGLLVEARR
jgi:hypothetical protein